MESGHAFGGNIATFDVFRRLKCRTSLVSVVKGGQYLEHSRLRLRTSFGVCQKVFLFTTLAGHKTASCGVQISG